jgi:hypothetical protein
MSKSYRVKQVDPVPRVAKHYWHDSEGYWVPCRVIEVDDSKPWPVRIGLIDGDGVMRLTGWTEKDRLRLDYE